MNIDQALTDSKIFQPLFTPLDSWKSWRVVLKAAFALKLTPAQLKLFQTYTGRDTPPRRPVRELVCICGRRSGKSRAGALIAVYLAAFKDYSAVLARGEQGIVMLLASDRNQSRVLFNYVSALCDVPLIAPLVTRRTSDQIFLSNRVSIEVATSNYRAVRGFTIVAAVCDELAYWESDDSLSNPDVEILAALRPAMSTVPGALLVAVSSPYAKSGALFGAYEKCFGKDGSDALVWKAESLAMNPTLDPAIVEAALLEDEPRARAEYLAEFRSDVERFVTREIVEECVTRDVFERAPLPGTRYYAFTDPSGGSSDSWTLAIAHRERDGRVVLDALRERKAPFDPSTVTEEFAGLLRGYRLSEVSGDKFAGEWPSESFKKHGIRYRASPKVKSDLYSHLLPLLNARAVDLLDSPRLVAQLVGLERSTSRSGRDSIDHRRGSHDDLANAVAGAAYLCSEKRGFAEWSEGDFLVHVEGDEKVFLNGDGIEVGRARLGDHANQVGAFLKQQSERWR